MNVLQKPVYRDSISVSMQFHWLAKSAISWVTLKREIGFVKKSHAQYTNVEANPSITYMIMAQAPPISKKEKLLTIMDLPFRKPFQVETTVSNKFTISTPPRSTDSTIRLKHNGNTLFLDALFPDDSGNRIRYRSRALLDDECTIKVRDSVGMQLFKSAHDRIAGNLGINIFYPETEQAFFMYDWVQNLMKSEKLEW